MTRTFGPLSVALSTNSFWMEIGKFSLHMTFDTFHWTPIVWSEETKRGADTCGNWLGLHFAGSRTD
jgi:hypothetical protein